MKYFYEVKNPGYFQPNFVASSVSDVNYNLLKKNGIKCVAFDIDGTLTRNKSPEIDIELAKLIKEKLDEAGIKTRYLASNSTRSLNNIAGILGSFEIHQPHEITGKPTKIYYTELLLKTEFQPQEVVMIGDRLLQDIWGANRAGLLTILVALNPNYATLRDKIIGRQWWQPIFVKRKIK